VKATEFEVVLASGIVTIRWSAESTSDVAGFNVYRSRADVETLELVNAAVIQGGSASTSRFEITDLVAVPGEAYAYWLEVIDSRGRSQISDPVHLLVPGNSILVDGGH
jgi:hypothetical protein